MDSEIHGIPRLQGSSMGVDFYWSVSDFLQSIGVYPATTLKAQGLGSACDGLFLTCLMTYPHVSAFSVEKTITSPVKLTLSLPNFIL